MMKAIQVPSKGETMKLVDVSIPKPGEGQVVLRVKTCGVCRGDSRTITGGSRVSTLSRSRSNWSR